MPWIVYVFVWPAVAIIFITIVREIVLLIEFIKKLHERVNKMPILYKNYNKNDQFDMGECITICSYMDREKIKYKKSNLTRDTICVISYPESSDQIEHLCMYGFHAEED